MPDIRLSRQDLERVVDATGLVASTGPGCGDAIAGVLDSLCGLVRCDVAFWNWLRLEPRFEEYALVTSHVGRPVARAPLAPWLEHLCEHPIMSGRHGTVTMVSDVLRGRALEASWLFQVAWAPEGLRSEIGLHLGRGPDERNVVVLSRGEGPGFSERDRLVLRLVRPHVEAAVRRSVLPTVSLTAREREVLVLVGEGMTNAQVARRLGVAEATVAKHLEHLFARTGLRSRVQLVASLDALVGR